MKPLTQEGWRSAVANADLNVVRSCASWTQVPAIRRATITLSWLGNGWIYAIMAGVLLVTQGRSALWPIGLAAVSIAILHCLYPYLKGTIQRARPYAVDASLSPLLPALDRYSFPSGHLMTLTASLVPVIVLSPSVLPQAILLWSSMAWARVASAHHYLSDILGGSVLGFFVAYPVSYCCQLWFLK